MSKLGTTNKYGKEQASIFSQGPKHNTEMNFEPQKFFIGLMDFFSILMPGSTAHISFDRL